MANKIQIKRGLKENLPALSDGEQALATDTNELFVGNSRGGGNVCLNGLLPTVVAENASSYGVRLPDTAIHSGTLAFIRVDDKPENGVEDIEDKNGNMWGNSGEAINAKYALVFFFEVNGAKFFDIVKEINGIA